MKRTVYTLLSTLLLIAAAGVPARSQCQPFPNQLISNAGLGCSYQISSQSGDVGCWASGSCQNGRNLYVSFYQEWACGQGHVDASGNNNIETTGEYCNEDYQYFDWGLNVNATAGVYEGGGGYAFYGGWESADCDGGSSFSGAFSYGC